MVRVWYMTILLILFVIGVFVVAWLWEGESALLLSVSLIGLLIFGLGAVGAFAFWYFSR